LQLRGPSAYQCQRAFVVGAVAWWGHGAQHRTQRFGGVEQPRHALRHRRGDPDVRAEIIANRVGIPRRSAQQALDAPQLALADRLSEVPAVLALDPAE
jgi:hypothetical protein